MKLNRRTRRPGRVFCRAVRIPRAGCSRDRRLAGDSGIDHQLLGSGRRRFTIHKVWPAAEKGYPYDGPVDLGCSQAPSRGLSSPWQAFSRRAAMPRQSFIVLELVFRKFQKSDRCNFQRRLPALSNLCDFWNTDMWAEQHGHATSYAPACESRAVPQREQTLKYCPSLQPFESALPREYRQEVDPVTQ